MVHTKSLGIHVLCVWIILSYLTTTASALVIDITYYGYLGVDQDKRDAIDRAANLWENWVTNIAPGDAGTLEIEVQFGPLSPDTAAEAHSNWKGHTGGIALLPAQYMAHLGEDLYGPDGGITFNEDRDWYCGSENPGPQQYDLVTHALHEIGHLMGMDCSYNRVVLGPVVLSESWGYPEGFLGPRHLTLWDTFLRDGNGQSPVPSPYTESFNEEDDHIFFVGPTAESVYGSPIPVVSVPETETGERYAQGTSLVHLNQGLTLTLMGQGFAEGVQVRGLTKDEVAVFSDLGWTFAVPREVHATGIGQSSVGPSLCWWEEGGAWKEGLPPYPETAVYLDPARDATYIVGPRAGVVRSLSITETALLDVRQALEVTTDCVNDGQVRMRLPSGSLTAGHDEFIGRSGQGYFTQSGGTHSVGQTLYLGREVGSWGSYDLSGTSTLQVNHDEFIGHSGEGYFTQSEGTHTVHDTLYLGREAGSSGSYELSGDGTLAVGLDEFIGYSGGGVFDQSGGTHTVGNTLYLGREAGSGGMYMLRDGGTLAVGSDEFIGYSGGGGAFFDQREGTHHTVGNNLYLAWAAVYSLYNATLAVGSDEYICYSGVANFTQYGGSHTVGGSLYLGTVPEGYPIGGGIYQLWRDGTLSVGSDEFIGYAAFCEFQQYSGMHSVGNNLYLGHESGSGGEYRLETLLGGDAVLLVGSDEFIGYAGEGGFSQVSGTHTVMGNLFLAFEPGSTGTYGLAGGMLSVHGGLSIRSGGDLRIGHPEWSPDMMGGKLSLYGGLTVESGGDLYNRGEVLIGPSVTASNAGRIAQDGESVVTMMGFADSGGSNTASLENLAGGLYDLQGDGDIVLGPSPRPEASVRPDQNLLNNYGTFRKSGGSGESVIEAKFTNSGLLEVQSGTLSFSGGFTQTAGATTVKDATIASTSPLHILGGSIGGTGQIVADIWNEGGLVSPGFSPGTLTIVGDYTQGPGATLLLEIAGWQPGQFDVFNVTGTATLDGFLEISLLDGFQPLMGDTFPIFTYGSLLGAFDSIYVMGLPGYEFIPTYCLDQLTLLTGNVPAAIPAPSSLCLVAVGVVSLLSRLRKRRTGSGAGRAAS